MANFIVDWRGALGIYRYWFLPSLSPEAIKDEPGNYLFAKRTDAGLVPVYFGQADSLRDRLPWHERWDDAQRIGATIVMAATLSGGFAVRCTEEQDLIGYWNPVLNTQHRSAPLDGLFGLGLRGLFLAGR